MNKVFIYIRDQKLKLSIIRILAANDISFIEASDLEEALIKLELVKNITLIIQEFYDREKALRITGLMRESDSDSRIPIVWIIPENRKDLVRLAAKWKINDLISLPLNESTFIRKLSSLLEYYAEVNKQDSKPNIQPGLLTYHSQALTDALDSAARGEYPLCVISMQVKNLQENAGQAMIGVLKSILRRSDSILEVDVGQYLILLPYTPKNSLPVVETKVRSAAESILKGKSASSIHIYGICFPDDVTTYNELKNSLTRGIEQSINISRNAEVVESYYQKKLSRYQASGQNTNLGQTVMLDRKNSRIIF